MAEPRASRRVQRILDVAGAALAALLAFTAVPAVLVLAVGNPLSGGLGHAWRPVPREALLLLALAAWVAWAACCAQLARGVVVRVRSGDVTAGTGGSAVDRLAIRIAAGVLALTGIGAPAVLSSGAGASPPAPPRQAAVAPASPPPLLATGDVGPHALQPAARLGRTDSDQALPSTSTHVVQPGDNLWSVAELRLDDGAAWTDLAALNLGRAMDGRTRFVDPDHVEPGWRLRLPEGAHGQPRTQVPRHVGGGASGHPAGGRLPELVVLGLGSLTCAALARRAGRRRAGDRFVGELDLEDALSEQAVDAAALLRRFDGVPALRAFEGANCMLRSALDGEAEPHRPAVRAICVSPHGVTFWLAEPGTDAPDGFAPSTDGAAWHVGHDRLGGHESVQPYVPVALPVGTDEDGTWLVCLGPGDVLPVLGEAASSLCRSARAATAAWAWSDCVLATDDPDDPRLLAELAHDPSLARHLVFFGDPAALPSGAAGRVAIVTSAPVAATGLSVLVDRHGATLHPMGRVVQPHLQSEETARWLEELEALEEPAEPRVASMRHVPEPGSSALGVDRLRSAGAPAAADPCANEADAWAPGDVDVRLLTMTPRLEGLREELPPNRARRAVELVAYLALHRPDVITSDRLRTRVLGSSDFDAASKTLFNTAHAARRAMGLDANGDPLFPAGTRSGHYQLSPRVTIDVRRAISLAAAGRDRDDPAAAIALYRAALDLVEGEPLANALAGYSWWEAEGHGGRIATVLVDAACSMAELAAEAGHFELARWGLERARLVAPYSEALSRAAMQLAAAEGDADRLLLEWRECQRRVDALDPGSSPSSRTESLYGELSRRVVGTTGAYVPAAGERAPAGS